MTTTEPTNRHGKGYKSFRRQARSLKRKGLPCWLCGKPIDPDLPHNDPQAFTADHVDPLAHGGSNHRGELRPAHRSCNAKRGTRKLPKIRPTT